MGKKHCIRNHELLKQVFHHFRITAIIPVRYELLHIFGVTVRKPWTSWLPKRHEYWKEFKSPLPGLRSVIFSPWWPYHIHDEEVNWVYHLFQFCFCFAAKNDGMRSHNTTKSSPGTRFLNNKNGTCEEVSAFNTFVWIRLPWKMGWIDIWLHSRGNNRQNMLLCKRIKL